MWSASPISSSNSRRETRSVAVGRILGIAGNETRLKERLLRCDTDPPRNSLVKVGPPKMCQFRKRLLHYCLQCLEYPGPAGTLRIYIHDRGVQEPQRYDPRELEVHSSGHWHN